MPVEATAETNQTAGVIPSAPWRIKALSVLPGYSLAVTFEDGTNGFADLSSILAAHDFGIYEELKDTVVFAQARLEMGVVTWPNGADLDPSWMHDELRKAKMWSVPI